MSLSGSIRPADDAADGLGTWSLSSLGFVDPSSLIFIAFRRRVTGAPARLLLCQVRLLEAKTAASGDTFLSLASESGQGRLRCKHGHPSATDTSSQHTCPSMELLCRFHVVFGDFNEAHEAIRLGFSTHYPGYQPDRLLTLPLCIPHTRLDLGRLIDRRNR